MTDIRDVIDLDRWPLDKPDSPECQALVESCRTLMQTEGMFSLEGFLRPEAIARTLEVARPELANNSFLHQRRHNIYFRKDITDIPPDHVALTEFQTSNNTICKSFRGFLY